MTADSLPLLAAAVLIVAFLYSSVGHAGATGYIAVMSLFSLAPEVIKPTALVLNIIVASIGARQFYRAGHFSWSLFWPFALFAPPLAFLGGYLHLPTRLFQASVGLVLLFSAYRFLVRPAPDVEGRPPPRAIALVTGAGLGLVAGLTGTGGGVLLTPVLLFMEWARVRQAAAVSALFILVNSIAGLAGNFSRTGEVPRMALVLCVVVALGGAAGSYFGSRHFEPMWIKRCLAVVLIIAGTKLLVGG